MDNLNEQKPVLRGGCQCGAVRYALYSEPGSADICHCRMCQKALGNLFMAAASVRCARFAWTTGKPALFRSSSMAERGFCQHCGTPLSFRYLGKDRIWVTIGSLDEAARAKPNNQIGIESALPWIEEALALPGKTTQEDPGELLVGMESFQHPDREVRPD